jgi:hypothetical protein
MSNLELSTGKMECWNTGILGLKAEKSFLLGVAESEDQL